MRKEDSHLPLPIICTVIVAILILVGLIGTALWYFFFPGINRLFDYVHFNVNEHGYMMSAEGEIIAEATLTAKGTVKRQSSEKTSNREEYDFYFEITGYPVAKNSASLWVIDNNAPKLFASWQDVELIGDGEHNQIQINSTTDYRTYLDPKYRDIIGCTIVSTDFDDSGSSTAKTNSFFVPAKNVEDALAQFELLLETVD